MCPAISFNAKCHKLNCLIFVSICLPISYRHINPVVIKSMHISSLFAFTSCIVMNKSIEWWKRENRDSLIKKEKRRKKKWWRNNLHKKAATATIICFLSLLWILCYIFIILFTCLFSRKYDNIRNILLPLMVLWCYSVVILVLRHISPRFCCWFFYFNLPPYVVNNHAAPPEYAVEFHPHATHRNWNKTSSTLNLIRRHTSNDGL